MAADPNILGLSIELQLNSLVAEKALESITEQIIDIDSQINRSLNLSLGRSGELINQIDLAMLSVRDNFSGVIDSSRDMVTGYDDIISKVNTINDIYDVIDGYAIRLGDTLNDTSNTALVLSGTFRDMNRDVAEMEESYADTNDGFVVFFKEFMKYYEIYKKYEELQSNIHDYLKDNDTFTKAMVLANKGMTKDSTAIANYSAITSKELNRESLLLNNNVERFQAIIKSIEKKNSLHKQENGMVSEEEQILSRINDLANDRNDIERTTSEIIKTIERNMYKLVALFRSIDDVAENFHKANYRGAGTMYDLADASYRVSLATGRTAQESAKMVAELLHVKTPTEDLQSFAVRMTMVARMTGLAESELAGYSRTMRNLGFSSADVLSRVSRTADFMARFGIETSDMQVMIGDLQAKFIQFGRTLSKDSVDSYMKANAAQLALAKSIGIGADAVKKMNDTSFDNMIRLQAITGREITSLEDFKAAQLDLSKVIHERMKAAGDDLKQQALTAKMLQAQYGITTEELRLYQEQGEKLEKLNIDPDEEGSVEKFNKAMESAADLSTNFSQSMNTLTRQLGMLLERGTALIAYFLIPVLEALTFFIYLINGAIDLVLGFINVIKYVVSEFASGIKYLYSFLEAIPFVGKLFTAVGIGLSYVGKALSLALSAVGWALKFIVGSLIVFVVMGGMFTGVLTSMITSVVSFMSALISGGTAFSTFMSGLLTTIQTGISAAVGFIMRILNVVGQGFVTILGYVGQGIARLANYIATSAVQLLIASVALLAFGLALYMVAQAISVLASVDPVKIGIALVTFAAMITIFALTMNFLLPLLPAAAAVLLPFAAVILAVGAAFLMAGAGVYLLAMAIGLLAGSITAEKLSLLAGLSIALFSLAASLVVLGPVALLASIPIMLLGLAMAVLGLGALMLSSVLDPAKISLLEPLALGLAAFNQVGILTIAKIAVLGLALLPLATGILFLAIAMSLVGDGMGTRIAEIANGIAAFNTVSAAAILKMGLIAAPLALFSYAVLILAMALSMVEGGFGQKFLELASGLSEGIKLLGSVSIASLLKLSVIALPLTSLAVGIAILAMAMNIVSGGFGEKFIELANGLVEGIQIISRISLASMLKISLILIPLISLSIGLYALGMALNLFSEDTASKLVSIANAILESAPLFGVAATVLSAVALPLLFGVTALSISILFLSLVLDMMSDVIETKLMNTATALKDSAYVILEAADILLSAAPALLVGSVLLMTSLLILGIASGMMFVISALLVVSAVVLNYAILALIPAGMALLIAGTSLLIGAIITSVALDILYSAAGVMISAGILLFIGASLVLMSLTILSQSIAMMAVIAISLLMAVPFLMAAISSIGLMAALLFANALTMYIGAVLLGSAINIISSYADKMNAFVDPLDRVASAFERLSLAMSDIRGTVSDLASLPLEQIFNAFNAFSPTEQALEKVERLSLALEKIGKEYAQAIEDEIQIASELTKGQTTTEMSPSKPAEEDPTLKTNVLLTEAKDTLDSILEALKPGDKVKFTSFGVSLFNSPRGFEI